MAGETKKQDRFPIPSGARPLEQLAVRPGVSWYMGGRSYAETLNVKTHRRVRMYDVGTHILLHALDEAGNVIDDYELCWHAVWGRRVLRDAA